MSGAGGRRGRRGRGGGNFQAELARSANAALAQITRRISGGIQRISGMNPPEPNNANNPSRASDDLNLDPLTPSLPTPSIAQIPTSHNSAQTLAQQSPTRIPSKESPPPVPFHPSPSRSFEGTASNGEGVIRRSLGVALQALSNTLKLAGNASGTEFPSHAMDGEGADVNDGEVKVGDGGHEGNGGESSNGDGTSSGPNDLLKPLPNLARSHAATYQPLKRNSNDERGEREVLVNKRLSITSEGRWDENSGTIPDPTAYNAWRKSGSNKGKADDGLLARPGSDLDAFASNHPNGSYPPSSNHNSGFTDQNMTAQLDTPYNVTHGSKRDSHSIIQLLFSPFLSPSPLDPSAILGPLLLVVLTGLVITCSYLSYRHQALVANQSRLEATLATLSAAMNDLNEMAVPYNLAQQMEATAVAAAAAAAVIAAESSMALQTSQEEMNLLKAETSLISNDSYDSINLSSIMGVQQQQPGQGEKIVSSLVMQKLASTNNEIAEIRKAVEQFNSDLDKIRESTKLMDLKKMSEFPELVRFILKWNESMNLSDEDDNDDDDENGDDECVIQRRYSLDSLVSVSNVTDRKCDLQLTKMNKKRIKLENDCADKGNSFASSSSSGLCLRRSSYLDALQDNISDRNNPWNDDVGSDLNYKKCMTFLPDHYVTSIEDRFGFEKSKSVQNLIKQYQHSKYFKPCPDRSRNYSKHYNQLRSWILFSPTGAIFGPLLQMYDSRFARILGSKPIGFKEIFSNLLDDVADEYVYEGDGKGYIIMEKPLLDFENALLSTEGIANNIMVTLECSKYVPSFKTIWSQSILSSSSRIPPSSAISDTPSLTWHAPLIPSPSFFKTMILDGKNRLLYNNSRNSSRHDDLTNNDDASIVSHYRQLLFSEVEDLKRRHVCSLHALEDRYGEAAKEIRVLEHSGIDLKSFNLLREMNGKVDRYEKGVKLEAKRRDNEEGGEGKIEVTTNAGASRTRSVKDKKLLVKYLKFFTNSVRQLLKSVDSFLLRRFISSTSDFSSLIATPYHHSNSKYLSLEPKTVVTNQSDPESKEGLRMLKSAVEDLTHLPFCLPMIGPSPWVDVELELEREMELDPNSYTTLSKRNGKSLNLSLILPYTISVANDKEKEREGSSEGVKKRSPKFAASFPSSINDEDLNNSEEKRRSDLNDDIGFISISILPIDNFYSHLFNKSLDTETEKNITRFNDITPTRYFITKSSTHQHALTWIHDDFITSSFDPNVNDSGNNYGSFTSKIHHNSNDINKHLASLSRPKHRCASVVGLGLQTEASIELPELLTKNQVLDPELFPYTAPPVAEDGHLSRNTSTIKWSKMSQESIEPLIVTVRKVREGEESTEHSQNRRKFWIRIQVKNKNPNATFTCFPKLVIHR